MNEILIVRRSYRDFIAGACLVLCGLLGCLLWLRLAAAGALGAVFLLAFTVGYALVTVSLLGHLFFCWRHRLQIDSGRIRNRGLFAVTEICLSDVTEVVWRHEGPGTVVLNTNFDKLTILFARYPPDASLRFIQFVRQAMPKSMQRDWNRFCLRIAIPLRNPGSDTRRLDVVFSRAQFDRLLSSLFFAGLAFAVGNWWLVGFPGDWTITLSPLALTGLIWISVRYFVPFQYRTKVQWIPLALFIDLIVDHLVWSLRSLGLILLCFTFLLGIPRGRDIAIAVIVITAVIEMARRSIKFWTYYKQERKHDLEHSEMAVREWELVDHRNTLGPQ